MLKSLLCVVLAVSALGGSSYTTFVPDYSDQNEKTSLPQLIVWCKDLSGPSQDLWIKEAKKRFTNPVLFSCHGGYELQSKLVDGKIVIYWEWWVYPDAPREKMTAQAAADTLSNLYPDRDIVFLSCNERGHALKSKRVFYAKSSIWIIPDDQQPPFDFLKHEVERNFGGVGSIWEFVSYDGGEKALDVIQGFTATFPSTQPTSKPSTQPATQPTTQPVSCPDDCKTQKRDPRTF